MAMVDEIAMKDKLDVLKNDALVRKAGTYHGIATADADQDRGGRYAGLTRPSVIGASPITYPQMPEGNPWRCDPVPPEMPLGYDINDQEPTGEIFEQQRSMSPSTRARDGDTAPPSSQPPSAGGGASTFKQRL
jgi:hypothetical protein